MIVSPRLAGFKRLIEHVVATFIVAAQHEPDGYMPYRRYLPIAKWL
jgi:hypothetical protein